MLQNMFHLGSSKGFKVLWVLKFADSPLLRIEVISVITYIFDIAQRNIVIRNQHYTLLHPL